MKPRLRKSNKTCKQKRLKIITSKGYVLTLLPEHHRSNRSGYVLEHIVIAEEMVGRKLKKKEVVHHIDRNRTNNIPSNLQVMTIADHNRLHCREDKDRFTRKPKEKMKKLPKGYYYLRGFEKLSIKEKIKENA